MGYGAVKPHVATAGDEFKKRFPGITSIGGWRATGSVAGSYHPLGRALDLMTRDKALGDSIAGYAIANAGRLAIIEIIWFRRYWTPKGGWTSYSGPSPHTDHVHLSFAATSGGGGAPIDDGSVLGGVADTLLGPLDELYAGVKAIIAAFSNISAWITNPTNWFRIGMFILGLVMLVMSAVGIFAGTATATKIGRMIPNGQ